MLKSKVRKFRVIVPEGLKPNPTASELSAARLLADFLQADVRFVVRGKGKTPDFCVENFYWELKTPIGSGKRTIQHAMHDAAKQSENLVLDLRKVKIKTPRVYAQVKYYFVRIPRLKRLLIIEKNGKVRKIF